MELLLFAVFLTEDLEFILLLLLLLSSSSSSSSSSGL